MKSKYKQLINWGNGEGWEPSLPETKGKCLYGGAKTTTTEDCHNISINFITLCLNQPTYSPMLSFKEIGLGSVFPICMNKVEVGLLGPK